MPLKGETIVTTKSPALTFRLEKDLKTALVPAKPAIFLKGSLVPMACFGVSPRLA